MPQIMTANYETAPADTPLRAYTVEELRRIFREAFACELIGSGGYGRVVIGTRLSSPRIDELVKRGVIELPGRQQGYTVRCNADPETQGSWMLVVAGADDRGVLYGLRDLEHHLLGNFTASGSRLESRPFSRIDWPRIEHRGHWVWGCNMPDKKAWMENMSRWKLNELIHWDNFPPERGREYVEFAHSRGISVNWGFGWGWGHWNVDLPADFVPGEGGAPLCPCNEYDRGFYRRVILEKIRNLYVPTGCDGIYFQSFTEFPKCTCDRCDTKTMGELMVEFCNPILGDIFDEFSGLWVSCGIHANFGDYGFLADLDARCNIYWENCDSGTSVRGDDEDFGYLNKTLPYAHGFGPDVPADPPWTEDSLREWMASNAERYRVDGPIEAYYNSTAELQNWARGMLGKPSTHKHAGTVADHSVFCRRTPFLHAALAEAQWNPDADTVEVVDDIVRALDLERTIPGGITGMPWTPVLRPNDPIAGVRAEPKPETAAEPRPDVE